MGVKVRCAFDETHVIDADAYTTYRYVKGWEHPRKDGGTNALALREPQDIYACSTCIQRIGNGVDPLQSTLV